MATKKDATTTDGGAGGGDEPFEGLLSRLEGLVTKLERGDLPLEDSLQAYEEGIGLVRRAQHRLDTMDRRLDELKQNGSLEPMEQSAMKAVAADRPATTPPAARPAAARPAVTRDEPRDPRDPRDEPEPGLYDDDLPF